MRALRRREDGAIVSAVHLAGSHHRTDIARRAAEGAIAQV